MALFPTAAESPRLWYELLHPDRFDSYDLYERVHEDVPDIESITRWVTRDPHPHPKETAEFVDAVGGKYDDDEGVTFAIYPSDGEDGAGEFAGLGGLSIDGERRRGELGV